MRKIDAIIYHATAAPEGSGQTVEEIRDYHVNVRGWSDIGYHYVIDDEGIVQIGRPILKMGAHAKGWNRRSIGIAYTGGGPSLDGQRSYSGPNKKQQKAMLDLTLGLRLVFPDIIHFKGHRDTGAKKDCPVFDVHSFLMTGEAVPTRNLA